MKDRIGNTGRLTALAAAILALGACCSAGSGARALGGAARPGDAALGKGALLCDVRVIALTADKNAHPDPQRVRRGIQVVVWVADTDNLTVTFPGENPFAQQPTCGGRFCYSIVTPSADAAIKQYDYQVTLARNGGKPVILDPRIEIMN